MTKTAITTSAAKKSPMGRRWTEGRDANRRLGERGALGIALSCLSGGSTDVSLSHRRHWFAVSDDKEYRRLDQ
jgi:hypothetical protein